MSAVLRRTDNTEVSVRIADLGLNAGVVLAFSGRNAAGAAGVGKFTLSLRPAPPAEPLGDDDPLAVLPFVALWVATAGAEPGEGPVVAVGTMRLAGARVFRTVSLSILIDPATPVAPEAAARHGITTETVAGARPFAEVWPAIQEALHHCVVVGVGVDPALAALARACENADLPPPALPPSLDLGALAGGAGPGACRGVARTAGAGVPIVAGERPFRGGVASGRVGGAAAGAARPARDRHPWAGAGAVGGRHDGPGGLRSPFPIGTAPWNRPVSGTFHPHGDLLADGGR
ncbi:hypothetical protein ACIU1J_07040 [Azospirillum doebereinerae]|uniref:3'-5' exonuclease n=1 Tax=Azospirillum doebereinerae TaxID=92933 RepID=UPI003850349D